MRYSVRQRRMSPNHACSSAFLHVCAGERIYHCGSLAQLGPSICSPLLLFPGRVWATAVMDAKSAIMVRKRKDRDMQYLILRLGSGHKYKTFQIQCAIEK